jgi:hypothetical protein
MRVTKGSRITYTEGGIDELNSLFSFAQGITK